MNPKGVVFLASALFLTILKCQLSNILFLSAALCRISGANFKSCPSCRTLHIWRQWLLRKPKGVIYCIVKHGNIIYERIISSLQILKRWFRETSLSHMVEFEWSLRKRCVASGSSQAVLHERHRNVKETLISN